MIALRVFLSPRRTCNEPNAQKSLYCCRVEILDCNLFSLKPRTEALARVLQSIHLDFDRQYRLLHVSLREPDGDRTDIAFRDHVIEKAGR